MAMTGQVGGRRRWGGALALPPVPEQLIVSRVAAQAVGNGVETPVQWDTVSRDLFGVYNAATPTVLRAPAGANWVRASAFWLQWNSGIAAGATMFYRFSVSNPSASIVIRIPARGAENGDGYPMGWLPITPGLGDVTLSVYHSGTTASLSFAEINLLFAHSLPIESY